jgi:hypothetical protein
MNKNKRIYALGAGLLALSLAACGSSEGAAASSAAAASTAASVSAEATEAASTTGIYTIYNATEEKVTELYLYVSGSSDKGDNLVGDNGLSAAHATVAVFDDGNADETLTLEFTTESGLTGTFETLHIEEVPISIITEDARTGATPIAFEASPAEYVIYNETGEEVTDLYLYATGSSDKGENLIAEAAQAGGSQTITLDEVPESLYSEDGTSIGHFTIEFTTASGYTGSFDNLSYEKAPIQLISEDAKTGATGIAFGAPEN